MPSTIQLLDTVAVIRDLPDLGLTAGEVGAVVEVLDGAYEVEFCDTAGQTYGLHTMRAEQLVTLHLRGRALKPRPEAA